MADEREIAHIPNGVTTHNIFKVAVKFGFTSDFMNYFALQQTFSNRKCINAISDSDEGTSKKF